MSDFIIKNRVLEKYTGNEPKAVIPDSVTEIGKVAFLGQTTLKEIIIPSSITKIGEHAL